MRRQHHRTSRTLERLATERGQRVESVGVEQHRTVGLGCVRNQPFDQPLRIIRNADPRSHNQRVLALEQHLQCVGRMRAIKMTVAIRDRLRHQFSLPGRDDRLYRFRHRGGNQARAGSERSARREQYRAGLAAAARDHQRMPVHALVRIYWPRANQMLQIRALEESAARRDLLDRARSESDVGNTQLAALPGARI